MGSSTSAFLLSPLATPFFVLQLLTPLLMRIGCIESIYIVAIFAQLFFFIFSVTSRIHLGLIITIHLVVIVPKCQI